MDILVETCLNDLYLLLIKNSQVVDKILIPDLREKSDHLPVAFSKLLQANKLDVTAINRFFVTTGPGSFMGLRAGLLYVQTLAGVLVKKMYVCDTLHFLQTSATEPVFIDARGGLFYVLENNAISLQAGSFPPTQPNYNFIENNLPLILKRFKPAHAFRDHSLYLKKPRIG